MPQYRTAEEVKEIAEKLIDKYHKHLQQAGIYYLFRDPAPKSKGDVVFGRTSKVSGKYKAISGYDFIIEISQLHFMNMEEKKRIALVDHELSHCKKEEDKYKTVSHDFEGFNTVLRRHGFWMGDLEIMGKTAKQLELPFEENDKPNLQVVDG